MKRCIGSLIAIQLLMTIPAYAEQFNVFSINNGDVTTAVVSLSNHAKPSLEVILTVDKAQELFEFTRNNLNQKVIVQINGETVSEAIVRAEISGGQIVFPQDDEDTAIRLAKSLMKK